MSYLWANVSRANTLLLAGFVSSRPSVAPAATAAQHLFLRATSTTSMASSPILAHIMRIGHYLLLNIRPGGLVHHLVVIILEV